MKYLLKILLFFPIISSIGEVRHDLTSSSEEIYFENPFLHTANIEGNGTVTIKYEYETFEGNKTNYTFTPSRGDYLGKFVSQHAPNGFFNNAINTIHTTRGYQFFEFNYFNYNFQFSASADPSFMDNFQSYVLLEDTSPQTPFVKVGTKWNKVNHSYSLNFPSDQFHLSQETSFLELKGYAEIDTPWGRKDAVWIEEKIHHEVTHEIADPNSTLETLLSDSFAFVIDYPSGFDFTQRVNVYSKKNRYYIKGLGLYSANTESKLLKNFDYVIFDLEAAEFVSDVNEIPKRYLNFKRISETKFDSTNMDLNVSDFVQIKKETFEQQQVQPSLGSWTWNGAFPWVYNHETASWFYYHFAGNTCNAYDARNGNWFTFNGTSNSWVKSN